MAPAVAEVKLVALRNCFANIPQSLTNLLGNANAVSLGSKIIAIEANRRRSFKMSSSSFRPEMRRPYLPRTLPSVQMVMHSVPSTLDGPAWQAHRRQARLLTEAEDATEMMLDMLR